MLSSLIKKPKGKEGLFIFKILMMNLITLNGRSGYHQDILQNPLRSVDQIISFQAGLFHATIR